MEDIDRKQSAYETGDTVTISRSMLTQMLDHCSSQ